MAGAETYIKSSITSGILIHPTVSPQYTNVTDRTGQEHKDRQTDMLRKRSDRIGRTVSGRPFVKRFAV